MFDHPVILLSLFTLIAVAGIGIWQFGSVRRSQARHGETPGETTMTRHTSRDELMQPNLPANPSPQGGAASGGAALGVAGDVASYKQQDSASADAANGPSAVRASLDVANPERVG